MSAALPITVTRWPGGVENVCGVRRTVSPDVLSAWLALAWPEHSKAHPGWSPVTMRDDSRAKGTPVEAVSALVLDIDHGVTSIEQALAPFEGIAGCWHTTRRSTADTPRLRIVLFISRPLTETEHAAVWFAAQRLAAKHRVEIDPQPKNASRFWYCPPAGAQSGNLEGRPLDVGRALAEAAAAAPKDRSRTRARGGEPAGEVIPEGARNATLTSLAGTMRRRGMSREAIAAALKVVNRERCIPPLDDREVDRTADSISRYEPAPWTFRRGDHAELADAVLASLAGDRSRLVDADGAIYVYDEERGIWSARSQDTLRALAKSFAGYARGTGTMSVSASAANGAIQLARADVGRPGYFDLAPHGVAMANGFVRVEHGRIVVEPHSPEHRCRHGHAFDFDPSATRKPLLAFMGELFADADEDERADRILLVQEFVGACLVGLAPSYQRCLALVGPGGNGKSELLHVMRSAMPDGTVVSLPPQLWSQRFQIARLVGATANFADELPESEIMSTGAFKAVVTGEPVHVERKHIDAWESSFRAGHCFACNALPATADLTDGFFRRFVLCNFTRRFDGTADHRPDAGQAVIDACRPGIVAWALDGAARLQQQGCYTLPESSREAMTKWRTESDSVALFIDAQCERGGETPASRLYGEYRRWTADNGHKPVSSKTFAQRMGGLRLWAVKHASANVYPVTVRDPWGDE